MSPNKKERLRNWTGTSDQDSVDMKEDEMDKRRAFWMQENYIYSPDLPALRLAARSMRIFIIIV